MLKLIKNKPRRYFTVHDGYLSGKENGKPVIYNVVSGSVTGISLEEEKLDGKKVNRWKLTMEDAGEVYVLNFAQKASTFVSIVRYLASDKGLESLNDIEIDVYLTENGYTNVTVMSGGSLLEWCCDAMPAASVVHRNGRDYLDDEEQMEWLAGLVERINDELSATHDASERESGHKKKCTYAGAR